MHVEHLFTVYLVASFIFSQHRDIVPAILFFFYAHVIAVELF